MILYRVFLMFPLAGYIMSGAIQALLVLVFGWECC